MLLKRMAPAFSDSDTRSASTPLLSVRALTVSYQMRGGQQSGVPALEDVHLDVPAGGALGVFGESGSGKSTLLLSMSNLLRSSATTLGSVLFGGRNLLAETEPVLRTIRGAEIGFVTQEAGSAFNPVRRIGEQVAEVVRAHSTVSGPESREAALDALDSVGLDSQRTFRAWPHQLSGGQRQRVLIARSLVCRPALLLADEPMHALDVRSRTHIAELLHSRGSAAKMALVIASHDPAVLRATTKRLSVFYAGQLIESGPTQEVLSQPLHPYTRALMNCFQLPARRFDHDSVRMKTIPGVLVNTNLGQTGVAQTGCRFVSRCIHRRPTCSGVNPTLLPVTSTREVRCLLYD